MTRTTPAAPQARRRTVLGAALLASAALGVGLLSACSSGQITGTDTQVPAVPGVNVNSTDGMIALRDGTIDYADEYQPGSTAPLSLRLFNNSKQLVRLTGVSSPNGDVVLVGGSSASASPLAAAPSTSPSSSGSRKASGSASASSSPSASPTPAQIGSAKINVRIPVAGIVVLSRGSGTYLAIAKLTGTTLKAGEALKNVRFTFTYADGSTTAISLPELPMAPPLTPLPIPSPVVTNENE